MNLFVTDAQNEILNDKHPVKIVLAGRRWGKTVMEAYGLIMTAQNHPGCSCWYVSNNYRLSGKLMRIMAGNAEFMRLVDRPSWREPGRFNLKNGSEIEFLSSSMPTNLRGGGQKLVCLDECGEQPRSLYEQILLPKILDTGGSIICTGTPNGRNWFWDLYDTYKDKKDDTIRSWKYTTEQGMRFQGAAGKKRLLAFKNSMASGTYEQECLCMPLSATDTVFRFTERMIDPMGHLSGPMNGKKYVAGLDLGRTTDPSCLVIIEVDSGRILFLRQFPLGMEHSVQAAAVKEVVKQYGCQVVIDTTGGAAGGQHESYIEFYRERLGSALREFTFTAESKRNLVNHLALQIEQSKIHIPEVECKELIAQVKSYRQKQSEWGMSPRFGAPSGEHDDQVMALGLACWGIKQKWFNTGMSRMPVAMF